MRITGRSERPFAQLRRTLRNLTKPLSMSVMFFRYAVAAKYCPTGMYGKSMNAWGRDLAEFTDQMMLALHASVRSNPARSAAITYLSV
jgi:hypothetical protein